jgi:hypothetical protein
MSSTHKIKELIRQVPDKFIKAKSKCFPKVTVQAKSTAFNTSWTMGSDLCPQTPHHEQTFSRLGLIKQNFLEDYEPKKTIDS